MSYVEEIYNKTVRKNPGEKEFHQAVKEVLDSLKLVIDANETQYRETALLERLVEPERIISFRVPWVDDNGRARITKGYRLQFNNAIGPMLIKKLFLDKLNCRMLFQSTVMFAMNQLSEI